MISHEPHIITTIPVKEAIKLGWDEEIKGMLEKMDCKLSFDEETKMDLPEDLDEWKFISVISHYGPEPFSLCYLNGPCGKSEEWGDDRDDLCERLVGISEAAMFINGLHIESVWENHCKYPFEIEDHECTFGGIEVQDPSEYLSDPDISDEDKKEFFSDDSSEQDKE